MLFKLIKYERKEANIVKNIDKKFKNWYNNEKERGFAITLPSE